jgi:hypothetical protein
MHLNSIKHIGFKYMAHVTDINVVYGFILDESARIKSKLDTGGEYDQGVGALKGEAANYLVDKAYLKDLRASRLTDISNRTIAGKLEIIFDKARVNIDAIAQLSDTEQQALFNIFELMYLQNTTADSTIATVLANDEKYKGYELGSYVHSTEYVNANLVVADDTVANLKFANWIEFKYRAEDGTLFLFHLWISSNAFKIQYPYITITSVIAPFPLATLVDPAAMKSLGGIGILTATASHVFSEVNLEAVARDQNGVYTFPTRYVLDARTTITIYFGLPYCGAKTPSSLDCRRAIREYLENNTSKEEDELKALFPDIYVDCRFYVTPLYDQSIVRASKSFYPSCHNLMKIRELAKRIYTDVEESYIDQYLEVLTNAQSKMILLCLPDANNGSYFSILDQHPTYQDYSTTDAGFRYMDGVTQNFSVDLNRVLAILDGVLISSEYAEDEIAGRTYRVFANGVSEYLVLTKPSYTEIFNPE